LEEAEARATQSGKPRLSKFSTTAMTDLLRVTVSFRLDVGRLDNRPPLLDLGTLKRRKLFRRLLFARRDVQSEIGEPTDDGRVRERADRRSIELGENVLRHGLGPEQPVPR